MSWKGRASLGVGRIWILAKCLAGVALSYRLKFGKMQVLLTPKSIKFLRMAISDSVRLFDLLCLLGSTSCSKLRVASHTGHLTP